MTTILLSISSLGQSFLTGGTLILSFNFLAKIRIVLPSVSNTPHGIVHRSLMKNLTSEYKLHFFNLGIIF